MALVELLAQAHGGGEGNLWNPTIIGVLTVICAVVLFCGSAYLLLGTNVGGRLGFLIAAAGLTGFMVLLTSLWLTTPGSATGNSNLDPPHGDTAAWEVIDVVPTPSESDIEAVRELETNGTAADSNLIVQVKPPIDAALVPAETHEGEAAPSQPFAKIEGISEATDFNILPDGGYYYIDKTENFFFHRARYAAIPVCIAKKDANDLPVSPPACDPLSDTQYVILRYDYGAVRLPVVAYWASSIVLFILSLLGLHWWEKDERARKRANLAPVPAPSS